MHAPPAAVEMAVPERERERKERDVRVREREQQLTKRAEWRSSIKNQRHI